MSIIKNDAACSIVCSFLSSKRLFVMYIYYSGEFGEKKSDRPTVRAAVIVKVN